VFSGGSSKLAIDYSSCGYVGVAANGRAQPPLDDAPAKDGLVSTQPFSNEIEAVFSPGVALVYYG
jgi:hypothetical protein